MWRLHSENGDCLAIKSTSERLESAMKHSERAVFGKVKYCDYESYKIDTDSAIAPIFHKRHSFNYESEFRSLIHFNSDKCNSESPTDLKALQPDGVPITVDVNDLVDEVVISPTALEEFEKRSSEADCWSNRAGAVKA
jgi:hypothetical protein